MNAKTKHWILMLACCLIPLILLGVMWNVGGTKTALFNSGWGWALILLCPLSHVLMMAFGLHGHDHGTPQPAGQEPAPALVTEEHHHH